MSDFARRGADASALARRQKQARIRALVAAVVEELHARGTPKAQWVAALQSHLRDLGIKRGTSALYADLEELSAEPAQRKVGGRGTGGRSL